MALQNKKKAFTALLVNISRLLLAATLVVSGFVKAVDPVGLSYKLREYMAAFGVDFLTDGWLQFAALLLAAAEFIMGVFLLTGVYRRVAATLTFLFFLFFTPFTLVLAIWNPVRDCGCFGDAIQISNWATFTKNIVLLVIATLVWVKRRMYVRRISNENRWMVALFAVCYISFVEGIALSHLPVVDFRPFAVGSSLPAVVSDIPSVNKTIYKFEKAGDVREFDDENYPDSTWNYLGSRNETVVAGRPALVSDFSFIDNATGTDYADAILSDTSYVCLLVVCRMETADESRVDKINDLYDYCTERGLAFYAATSSDDEQVTMWRKRTGAEYPILWADEIMLKTVIRANPGLLLLKDGIVVGKWNANDLPSYEQLSRHDTFVPHELTGIYKYIRGWRPWIALFVLPLSFIILVDAVAGRLRKKQSAAPDTPSDT